jgi:hypothetical protein
VAGNKKPRKKHGMKTGSDASIISAKVKAYNQGIKERRKLQERADHLNTLPLSHPMSCHMIEKTMAPLDRFLDQHEQKGGFVMEDGEPVLWDGECWIQVIPGVLHMCYVFEKMAQACVWPKMPPGLRAYAIGLQIGRSIDADDFKDSRETIAWMRKWMGTITPLKWRELFDWATSLDEKQQQNAA